MKKGYTVDPDESLTNSISSDVKLEQAVKNRRKLRLERITHCRELFQDLLSGLPKKIKSKICRKTTDERLFEIGRQKFSQELDIIKFFKYRNLTRGAIKSLTSEKLRRKFFKEARYSTIFLNNKGSDLDTLSSGTENEE